MAVAPRWSASTLAEEAESNFLLKWSSCFRGGVPHPQTFLQKCT